MKSFIAGLLAVLALTAGCATDSYRGSREVTGGMAGAALGGFLGSQMGHGRGNMAATAAGVFLGGLLGSEVGRSMDEVDRMRAGQAQGQAQTAPLGESITWSNPRNDHHGSVTAVRDGYSESGRYCREFHHTVIIGGRSEEAYGVACRQPDGAWEIQPQG
ncbi:MAG TPA: RT0821/Lpp0805 family surface protein [Gammaproteobacteria bacterium]|nr:RT0821/Lpp0805 family surface protein [Gammaproteobacteria bacterium]